MTVERATAPPRGTRPRNRRSLIIAAASDLFHRKGYEQVAMSDVASAVNVRPSALYRHFSGKPELFTATVVAEMAPLRKALAHAGEADMHEIVRRLASVALEHSRLGVLWQREVRALPPEEYSRLRDEITTTVDMLTELIKTRRPALGSEDSRFLALCVASALCSVSNHADELPRARFKHVLRQITLTIILAEPAPHLGTVPAANGTLPSARRERLLDAAITLFADRGYAAVSMEEIGAQAGIAGPSVYHHFSSKQQLLGAAMARGDEWLRYEMHHALRGATEPALALERLLGSYVEFAANHNEHINILVTESRHLGEEERASNKQSQRDYIGEWVHLMLCCDPTVDEPEARIRVHAVLGVVNDVARTVWLRRRPHVLESIKSFGAAVVVPPFMS